MSIIPFFLLALIFFIIIAFFTVEQQSAYIIERFGKFNRISTPGLNFKIPLIENIRGKVSLGKIKISFRLCP